MSQTVNGPPLGGGISALVNGGGNGAAVDPIALARRMMPGPDDDRATAEPEEEELGEGLRERLQRWARMMNVAEDKEISGLLESIAARVKQDYDLDENSRNDWREKYRKWLDFALQIAQQKTFPWPDACYSLDTDVMTETGWKAVAEIQVGERVLSRAPNGSARFYPVTERHRFTALSMVHFHGKSIDLMVTPNHRMLVEGKTGKRKPYFIEAGRFLDEDFTGRYIPLTSRWDGPNGEIRGIDASAYARFVGWYISEGSSFTGRNTHTLKNGIFKDYGLSPSSFAIAQSPSANPEKFAQLARDIAACGFTYRATRTGYIVHARSMPQWVKDQLRSLGTATRKHIPRSLMEQSSHTLEALLDGLVSGDGTVNRRHGRQSSWSYSTVSRQLADDVQELCQRIGTRGTISSRAACVGGVINGRAISGSNELFTVQINRKRRIQIGKMGRSLLRGPCEVACVTVEPYHTVYVRRNGKALWCGNSNVIYPLMTTAAIQFAARAYPAIIRDQNVVKGRVIGKDDGVPNPAYVQFLQQRQQQTAQQPPTPMGPGMPPNGAVMPGMGPANNGQPAQPPAMWSEEPGAKLKRASAIGRHMSWQLLSEQEEWEPQTDTLLVALPIVGTYFRKTYYDPSMRRNVSETVDAMALCVNYYAKSFETAPRQTELIRLYPHEIETAIRSGLFIDYGDGAKAYGRDQGGANTNDQEQGRDPNAQQDEDAATTFLEQHCRYDLDDDGYAEPWIITVARDSGKLARISAGYEMDGVSWTDDGRVRKIDKVAVYTKYGFIPSPDSKVYDLGFGHLLYPINDAINTTLNQMFDAGSLQNVGGGFIGSGLSVNTGAVRFAMGEYKPVNVMGGTIRDNVFAIPFPGPSAVLMQLLTFLVEAGERVAAVKDVMTGDMPGDNTSGITTLAVIEQGLKVFSAIYKRIYRSLTYEFKKLYRLNRIYGADEMEFEGGGVWSMVKRADYEAGAGVEPVSDPQMVTDMQRLGRAQFMLTFKDDPRVKGQKVIQDAWTAAMIPDAESYMNEAPPAPDPKFVLKNRELDIREKREMIDLMLREQKDKALIIKDITQAELFLAQVRKLDNDQQLGWVEMHLQKLRDQLDAVSALSGADHSALGTESGAGGAAGAPGTDGGAMGGMASPPGVGAPAGPVPA